jgi:hypothetical protein
LGCWFSTVASSSFASTSAFVRAGGGCSLDIMVNKIYKINSNNDLLYLPPSSKGALTSSWISSRHCWPRTIPICCCLTKIALVDPWPAISGSHPARQWPSCLSSLPVCISICEWQRSCGIWCCWGCWPIGDSQRCFSRCDAVEDEGYLVPFEWENHWIT